MHCKFETKNNFFYFWGDINLPLHNFVCIHVSFVNMDQWRT